MELIFSLHLRLVVVKLHAKVDLHVDVTCRKRRALFAMCPCLVSGSPPALAYFGASSVWVTLNATASEGFNVSFLGHQGFPLARRAGHSCSLALGRGRQLRSQRHADKAST